MPPVGSGAIWQPVQYWLLFPKCNCHTCASLKYEKHIRLSHMYDAQFQKIKCIPRNYYDKNITYVSTSSAWQSKTEKVK